MVVAMVVQRHFSCTPGAGVWTVRPMKSVLGVDGPLASIAASSAFSCTAEVGKLSATLSKLLHSYYSGCKLSSAHQMHYWEKGRNEAEAILLLFLNVFC